ncbi:MAG: SPOR domain-containing protein [Myxococcales bacterium]|nr:SPOR domain-containing protein [Myxococcales bacterium]
MTMESVNVRNLEQIQEEDPKRRSSRLAVMLLSSIGGAAIVMAGVMAAKRTGPPATSGDDPLSSLVAQAKSSASVPADKLDGTQVTFPDILSDQGNATTALAAVKDERGNLLRQSEELVLPPGAPTAPPPASDRLPVVPLPAGSLLSRTNVTAQPKDQLTQFAASASNVDNSATAAPPGAEGGYQIQVASFRIAGEADAFALDLQKRGHRAYRQAAYVADRGLWHRVRIGPFKTKFEAIKYREKFEKTERVSPFVVDPAKVKLAEDIRAQKMAIRAKKKGSGRVVTGGGD